MIQNSELTLTCIQYSIKLLVIKLFNAVHKSFGTDLMIMPSNWSNGYVFYLFIFLRITFVEYSNFSKKDALIFFQSDIHLLTIILIKRYKKFSQ